MSGRYIICINYISCNANHQTLCDIKYTFSLNTKKKNNDFEYLEIATLNIFIKN